MILIRHQQARRILVLTILHLFRYHGCIFALFFTIKIYVRILRYVNWSIAHRTVPVDGVVVSELDMRVVVVVPVIAHHASSHLRLLLPIRLKILTENTKPIQAVRSEKISLGFLFQFNRLLLEPWIAVRHTEIAKSL